jgi:hypothetical protein
MGKQTNEQRKFDDFLKRPQYPQVRENFFERPHWTRRRFFQLAGAGVSGAVLAERATWGMDGRGAGVTPRNTARNVIFILLQGAPSQVDTFDFKYLEGVTPASFAPETVNGVLWPTGLLPKLGQQLSDFAIVRSMRSHALVHTLSQTWTQIGRNPVGSGLSAPHIGSIVAIEKEPERKPGQKFPTFLALNSNNAEGPGYLQSQYGAFKVTADPGGIADAGIPGAQSRFNRRWSLLHSLDDGLRLSSPGGKAMEDYNEFYSAAQGLMYDPVVNQSLGFTPADSARYGGSAMGNACLVASQVVKAQQGTRFIQITSNDGWDMHTGIYQPNGLPAKGKILDNALSALLSDLKSNGLLSSTLVVMLGEFGRTVGPLTAASGRDHYPQQFAFFAGGGVRGGTIIGATNARGSDVAEYGWSRQRYVYMEDIEATMYSALGIDWTYVRTDDPLHRRFEYVPFSGQDVYGPIHELWG